MAEVQRGWLISVSLHITKNNALRSVWVLDSLYKAIQNICDIRNTVFHRLNALALTF